MGGILASKERVQYSVVVHKGKIGSGSGLGLGREPDQASPGEGAEEGCDEHFPRSAEGAIVPETNVRLLRQLLCGFVHGLVWFGLVRLEERSAAVAEMHQEADQADQADQAGERSEGFDFFGHGLVWFVFVFPAFGGGDLFCAAYLCSRQYYLWAARYI